MALSCEQNRFVFGYRFLAHAAMPPGWLKRLPMSVLGLRVDFAYPRLVRFAPDSDRLADVPGCPEGAICVNSRRSKSWRFNRAFLRVT